MEGSFKVDHYSRHELKEDKVAEGAVQAAAWVSANRTKVVIPAIVVLLVAAIAGGLVGWYQLNNKSASVVLGRAFATYNAPLASEARPGVENYPTDQDRLYAAKKAFYAVSDAYPHTKAGQAAHFMAATIELELGNNQIAEDQLKSVAAHAGRDYSSMANLSLASLYHATGRDAEALELYKKLADHPSAAVSKVSAQLAQADMLAATSPDQARKLYEQIAKDNAKTDLEELAKSKSEALGK